jgi:hypothetical protein
MPPQQARGPDSPDRGKLRVFISYSRDDLKFADQLDAALNAPCSSSGSEYNARRTLLMEATSRAVERAPAST